MIDIIYILMTATYSLLIISFIMKDRIIFIFTGMMMMMLSVYVFQYGLDIFNNKNILSIMFSSINFGIGAYVASKPSLDLIQEIM